MCDPKPGLEEASYSISNPHMSMEEPSQLSIEDEKKTMMFLCRRDPKDQCTVPVPEPPSLPIIINHQHFIIKRAWPERISRDLRDWRPASQELLLSSRQNLKRLKRMKRSYRKPLAEAAEISSLSLMLDVSVMVCMRSYGGLIILQRRTSHIVLLKTSSYSSSS